MPDLATSLILEQYAGYDEDRRLEGAFGSLEKILTQELVNRFLPAGPINLMDVGGATGAYSFWLAGLGHRVHLVDIVPHHIQAAARKMRQPGVPAVASLSVGDARHLNFPDSFADVILCHGPLYHLVARSDRLQALSEAHRVLRPGGLLLAFTITRYAGINYAISSGQVFNDLYFSVMQEEVQTGVCNNTPKKIATFNSAYFHMPDEVQAEVEAAGFSVDATLGVMGTTWLVPDLETAWQDEHMRRRLLETAHLLEHQPVLSPRMLTVARK
jgi:ubiquinone/menaquinone biosynthesis C-methylase UbiE